jgi:lipopolysaccharide/colanic/teichoic acid biosynthesis glycosyltransferase
MFILIVNFIFNYPPLFFQKRVGLNLNSFILIKFRTMIISTPNEASHLIEKSNITPFGNFLRNTKLDELPQLWNVIIGDMSFIGPRPCLLNQYEIIEQRLKLKVFSVRPGLTGLSQISGIDMSNPVLLAQTDFQMISNMNIIKYFYYLYKTIKLVFHNKK